MSVPSLLFADRQADRGGGSRSRRDRNDTISSVGDRLSRRIYIEDVFPSVDGGRFAVKRVAGEAVEVWADIFRDGHAVLAAELLWRPEAAATWSRVAMRMHGNDRSGSSRSAGERARPPRVRHRNLDRHVCQLAS